MSSYRERTESCRSEELGEPDEQAVNIPISEIRIEESFRKDDGDLVKLAESIRARGLLQSVGITERGVLVFGHRRFKVVKDILKWDNIPARIIKLDEYLSAAFDENEVRKEFTLTERRALAERIKKELGERRGRSNGNNPEELRGVETADVAAKKAGLKNGEQLRQITHVETHGVPELADAMDKGEVALSAAYETSKLPREEQEAAIKRGPKGIKDAAKEKREQSKNGHGRTKPRLTTRSDKKQQRKAPELRKVVKDGDQYRLELTLTDWRGELLAAMDNGGEFETALQSGLILIASAQNNGTKQ